MATVFLGIMTLRLGRAANAASGAALEIADKEATYRAESARDERLMLLMWISGEVSTARAEAENLESQLTPAMEVVFHTDIVERMKVIAALEMIAFPNAIGRQDRLHAIGHPVAAKLARALAATNIIQVGSVKQCRGNANEVAEVWRALGITIPIIAQDLKDVDEACIAAAKELGIRNI